MRSREERQYKMLVRIRSFVHAHGELFSESSAAATNVALIDAVVTRLGAHDKSKMSAARRGSTAKAAARTALIAQLRAVGATARAMHDTVPGIRDKFRLPHSQADQTYIAAGRVFASHAKAFERQFIAQAMPKTFIADLIATVEAFESSIGARDAAKDEFTAARASIAVALASGLAAARTLDVVMANRCRDDRGAMAAWLRDRRVGYRSRI